MTNIHSIPSSLSTGSIIGINNQYSSIGLPFGLFPFLFSPTHRPHFLSCRSLSSIVLLLRRHFFTPSLFQLCGAHPLQSILDKIASHRESPPNPSLSYPIGQYFFQIVHSSILIHQIFSSFHLYFRPRRNS